MEVSNFRAYYSHLIFRSIYQTALFRKSILSRIR